MRAMPGALTAAASDSIVASDSIAGSVSAAAASVGDLAGASDSAGASAGDGVRSGIPGGAGAVIMALPRTTARGGAGRAILQ